MILFRQRFLLLAFLLTAACAPSDPDASADKTSATAASALPLPAHMCFLQTTGKDTSQIEIYFSGPDFSGIYDWVPFEKDARRGTVQGKVKATGEKQLLKGTWTYMQEGIKQELSFEALVSAQSLQQRDYEVDSQTGKEVLSADERYTAIFKTTPCKTP